jgi:transposase InsO family protein
VWSLRRLFTRAEGLRVVVATRCTRDLRDEQPTQECANDATWSSGNGSADTGGRPAFGDVAAGFGISERPARKWLCGYDKEGLAGLENRSSRPGTVANRTGEPWLASIERLRREYRMTGEEIAEKLSMASLTVAGWLTSLGRGPLAALEPKAPVRRYQRERLGELLHLDINKLVRFEGVGHRITGDRRGKSRDMGYDCLHVAIDDATRLAYFEVLPDEKRRSTTGFLVRALRWFKAHGVVVERVITDNGSGYVAKLFRKALRILGIRHIRTRPYTPKTKVKAERFIQITLREWAYEIRFSSSYTRAVDLAQWLSWYNDRGPHSALSRRAPTQALAGIT